MESIKENQQKSNSWGILGLRKPILLAVVVILAGSTALGLFQLFTVLKNKDHGRVIMAQVIDSVTTDNVAQMAKLPTENAKQAYVASKNGKAYYLPTCGGVSRIKEENKVYFATKQEAESAGYRPAGNCPGLK